jgi:hypothetical protein
MGNKIKKVISFDIMKTTRDKFRRIQRVTEPVQPDNGRYRDRNM